MFDHANEFFKEGVELIFHSLFTAFNFYSFNSLTSGSSPLIRPLKTAGLSSFLVRPLRSL